jgi:cytochrome P450 family 4
MAILTIIFFSAVAAAFILWYFRELQKNKEFYKNIPGPPVIPIFGNVLSVRSTKDILKVLFKWSNEYGGLYKMRLGPIRWAVVAADYDFLECVLSNTQILNKSDDYLSMRPWLGTGLLTSDGTKWKKHRRILTPAFHFQILEQFVDVFESAGNRLVKKLRNEIGKNSVDIYPYVTLCTLDIICESAMGTSINAQYDGNSDYVQSVKSMCKVIIERTFNVLEMNDVTIRLTKNYYLQKKSLNVLHAKTNSVIVNRRKELENNNKDLNNVNGVNGKNEEDMIIGKDKKAFLDLLLEATVDGKPLTQEEIREEVDTFMFEGHDTTASAISFVLYCLANHPEVQQKAYEEQQMLFDDDKNPTVTYTDLQSMKYLEQVIKEALRLYPSVPIYGRKTNAPVKYNDISIPKDVTIAVFAFGIHRNPKYFKEPEKFNPGRFENMDGRLPYAYIPFSAGPRNCIGQKFAMLEMKSTVSKILRNFELEPASPEHKLNLVAELVLKSANGIKIALNLRK